MKMRKIEGDTYEVKEQLKALGAKWDKNEKAWYIAEDKLAEAQAFVSAVPPKEPKEPRKRKPIHARCPVCGTEFDI